MNQADINEFIVIGLAGICALAYFGWTYHQIKLAIVPRDKRKG